MDDFLDDQFYEELDEALDEALDEPLQQMSDDIDSMLLDAAGTALEVVDTISKITGLDS